ncbi:MAG: Rpn family recombination-promoting nuclease/putative transposase, partial [Deltaproteobacteria bacterium]|nr:Rpn family recombination-promoting nuclease/putative transposase [Deltaproteobacteria bacterium]
DIIEVNTLELPKLPGERDDTALWDWLKFLKSSSKEELAMLSENNQQIQKAVGILMELSADEQTRLLEESREKARWDEMSRLRGAMAEGEAKGVAIGETKGKADVARGMIQEGIAHDIIMRVTGLSLDEIADFSKTLS